MTIVSKITSHYPVLYMAGHTGDWQIELVLPGGVTLRMNSTA
jgi:hypothetical protein